MKPREGESENLPQNVEELASQLAALQRERKAQTKRPTGKRTQLSPAQRQRILQRTGGRCHLCGGLIEAAWQADHVLAHSGGSWVYGHGGRSRN